jgi:hypothetical protein
MAGLLVRKGSDLDPLNLTMCQGYEEANSHAPQDPVRGATVPYICGCRKCVDCTPELLFAVYCSCRFGASVFDRMVKKEQFQGVVPL